MQIIDRLKTQWHRDLARDPLTHGWVLNLYLNGERYPQTVCDYFQSEFAPTRQLADDLDRHNADEHKHEMLFAKAIESMRQPVVHLPASDIFNEVIKSFTPGSFHIVASDSADQRRLKLANFLAHANLLERRVARSLCYHLEGCAVATTPLAEKVVASVLNDEERHVRYTAEAVGDLLTRAEARRVWEEHRRAEARANLRFSHTQVKNFLRAFQQTVPRRRRLLYRVCAILMEGAERLA
jgi:hypothetical protein